MDIDATLDGLESDVWARIDADARRPRGFGANGAVVVVCALILMVSSAIGASTAAASAPADAGPFALDQPYAPATALGQ